MSYEAFLNQMICEHGDVLAEQLGRAWWMNAMWSRDLLLDNPNPNRIAQDDRSKINNFEYFLSNVLGALPDNEAGNKLRNYAYGHNIDVNPDVDPVVV